MNEHRLDLRPTPTAAQAEAMVALGTEARARHARQQRVGPAQLADLARYAEHHVPSIHASERAERRAARKRAKASRRRNRR